MTRPLPVRGAPVKLPRGSQILRVLHGDSLPATIDTNADIVPHPNSIGVAISELVDQSSRGFAPADTVVYRNGANYWSKFFHFDGTNWVITRRTNTTTDEGDNIWTPLHDRAGWNLGAPFATLDLASATSVMWHLDVAMEQRGATYVDTDGRPLERNYLTFIASASKNATSGNPVLTWDASPTVDSLTHRFKTYWFDPAVAALRTKAAVEARAAWEALPTWSQLQRDPRCIDGGVPETPVIVLDLVFYSTGGADTIVQADANALGTNLGRVLNAQRRNYGGAAPTVLLRPFYTGSATFAYWSEAQASFDAAFDAFATPQLDYIRLDSDISFQEERLASGASIPGIHPDANGMPLMAQRIADAYDRMASRGARAVQL
jgi:hypothetical protein